MNTFKQTQAYASLNYYRVQQQWHDTSHRIEYHDTKDTLQRIHTAIISNESIFCITLVRQVVRNRSRYALSATAIKKRRWPWSN